MAEFNEARAALDAARQEKADIANVVFRERRRLTRLERAQVEAPRFNPDGDPALDDRVSGQHILTEDLEGRRIGADARVHDAFNVFADFTDPREHIGNLSDRTPFLLSPVRIETRFLPATGDTADGQMLVRVYPDDLLIDSFEETFTESETIRARAYWANLWVAGGDQAAERGAWRVLVGSHGSGRAYWLRENYQPINIALRPMKDPNTPAIILPIPTQAPLVDPDRSAIRVFWEAIWRAGEDGAAQSAAAVALVDTVGEDRAGELQRTYVPINLAQKSPDGATRIDTTVIVDFVEFLPDDDVPMREAGWGQAPRAELLPDRLLLLGYVQDKKTLEVLGAPIHTPLVIGPDPSAAEDQQLQPDGDDIKFGDDMLWVVDFERALEVGMAFRVMLDPISFRRGFDKLMVIGVRLRSDATASAAELQQLIEHHHQSRNGFTILPQGRPTNNVEDEGSDYSWKEDSDISFDHYFDEAPPDPTAWFEKRDGRWLAEMLGLEPSALAALPHYGRSDVNEARAMNVALWPATLGYFMESMLHPVFDDAIVRQTREFFGRYVTGRGPVPAIRIGRQPYGVLPATTRSRMNWIAKRRPDVTGTTAAPLNTGSSFLPGLYTLLQKVESDWEPLAERASFIGKPGIDSHQVLLDVVGLHVGSVERHQRYAESFQQLYNRMSMQGQGGAFLAVLISLGYVQSGFSLLSELGYAPEDQAEIPDLLEKLFLNDPNLLSGPLIDDRPSSETDAIRAYTAGGDNYLHWLIDAADTSHDMLRLQAALADDRPAALLYLMMHRALDMSFVESSLQVLLANAVMSQATVKAARREAKFIHVEVAELADPDAAGRSRWAPLYQRNAAITGDDNTLIGTFLAQNRTTMVATEYLNRQIDALNRLKDRPTAVLQRVFAEHLDLCSYRLDAWWGGLMTRQLEMMRYEGDGVSEQAPAPGVHLGVYGWLEDVRPEFKRMDPVDLPSELSDIFERQGDAPLSTDSTNQGYIHAPSLNHAVTAAILRNGYISNAQPETPEAFKVNLSSERVRNALAIIQGMQAGQSLEALLGYRFERGLHDRNDVEVDSFIYELRFEFPLGSNRLQRTRVGRIDELGRRLNARNIEARNVVNGVALTEHIRESGQDSYPFGLGNLPAATPAQALAISDEAARIADIADAVADLAMAESIHQVAQGNYDRAGAVLDTYSKGKFPQTPDVIKTPRSGPTITHRTALHFEAGLDPNDPANISVRAQAEPAINRWLAGMLPEPDRVAALVTLTDLLDGSTTAIPVTQAVLGLLPIDLLYHSDFDNRKAMNALDDRIEAHIVATLAPRPHVEIAIDYRARVVPPDVIDHISFFELAAYIRSLRAILLDSRPLKATDMSLTLEARGDQDVNVFVHADRVSLVRTALDGHLGALDVFRSTLDTSLQTDPPDTVIGDIDVIVQGFLGHAQALAPFSEIETGVGGVLSDRRGAFRRMLELFVEILTRWQTKLAEFDDDIAEFDELPVTTSDEERFLILRKAERRLSTSRIEPSPADPVDFRNDLAGALRTDFVTQQATLQSVVDNASTLSGLFADLVTAETAIAAFDAETLDPEPIRRTLVDLATRLFGRATAMTNSLTAMLAATDAHIAAAMATTTAQAVADLRIAALKRMLGEDTAIVPEFGMSSPQTAEWANAWGGGPQASTALLSHMNNTLGNPFPVDDWLHGIARVREKMGHVENATLLAETLAGVEFALQPLQFPYRADEFWLGLEFPDINANGDPFVIDEEKLLYTGHFATAFAAGRQCGLLLDEWTETIPSLTEDTGLTFHFDRPNSEPPQAILLCTPSDFLGGWRLEDLIDTVHETFDLARKRAIEPEFIDDTNYARFLPAVYGSVTLRAITATLNFSQNNQLASALGLGETDE